MGDNIFNSIKDYIIEQNKIVLPPGVDNKNLIYYIKCMIGGAIACGLTHCLVTPLDLIKCRRQVDPSLYNSFGQAFYTIIHSEGYEGLVTGWLPTLIGYNL